MNTPTIVEFLPCHCVYNCLAVLVRSFGNLVNRAAVLAFTRKLFLQLGKPCPREHQTGLVLRDLLREVLCLCPPGVQVVH